MSGPGPRAPPSSSSSSLGAARRRLSLFALLDELGPLLAIYTLWFDDVGVTAAQVSTLFALWAGLGIVLEVPSGALADRVDRRRLVAAAMALRAAGIATWFVWPTYPGAVVGALLWAAHTATASGTFEALVFEQLRAADAMERYPVVMARIGQLSHIGTAAGAGAATGLLALGVGLPWLGAITIALHLPAAWAILSLPAAPRGAAPDEGGDDAEEEDDGALTFASWWRTLRDGIQVAVRSPRLGLLVATAALLEGIFIVDEYVPLLARFRGAPDAWVPVFVVAVWGGLILGGEVAARRPSLRGSALAAVVWTGFAAIATALVTSSTWPLALIGVGYGAMNTAWILTEARLQEHAPAHARATVRSVVALLGGLISAGAFLLVRAMADGDDLARGVLAASGVLVVVGALLLRLPDAGSVQAESAPAR